MAHGFRQWRVILFEMNFSLTMPVLTLDLVADDVVIFLPETWDRPVIFPGQNRTGAFHYTAHIIADVLRVCDGNMTGKIDPIFKKHVSYVFDLWRLI